MSAEIQIELSYPAKLSRSHLLVRLLIAIATGGLFHAIGWPGGLLYFGLPALAAVLVAQHGPPRYLASDGPRILRVLEWILAFYAYMALLTDEFPLEQRRVRYELEPAGTPTVTSAVLRIFTTIPAALVLALIGFVSGFLTFCAMVAILIWGHYPRAWFELQCGVLRVHARVLAYHASLTEAYPTFSFHGASSLPTARAV